MEETVSLEPQEAQPAPEPTSRKDSKTYKTVKTIVTFSLLGIIILNILISLLCYIGAPEIDMNTGSLVYKDTNVFTLVFAEDGWYKTLMDLFEYLSSGSSVSMTYFMTTMLMLYGLLIGVLVTMILSIVTLIKTIMHTVKQDTEKLTIDLIDVVKMNMTAILLIKLFTISSGGSATYKVGGGLIASLVISLVALLAIAVVNFIFFKGEIHKANKYKQILRSISTCLCHLIAYAVLAAVAYFGCLSIISLFMAYMEMGISPSTEVILYMAYNLVTFSLVATVADRLTKGVTNSLKYLCTLSDTPSKYEKKASSGFIGAAVMTLISFILLLLAKDYAGVESGYLIGACIVAIVGEVCYILLNKLDLFKEEAPQAVSETAPATADSEPADDNTTNS